MIGLSLSDVGQMGRLRMMEVDDDFNRSGFSSFGDGLGVSPQGLPWEQLKGSWRITDGRANTSAERGSNPISRIFVGSPNIAAEIWLSNEGGDCIYFRVQDEDNWWRVRQSRWEEDKEEEYTERKWTATYKGTQPVTYWRHRWHQTWSSTTTQYHGSHSHANFRYHGGWTTQSDPYVVGAPNIGHVQRHGHKNNLQPIEALFDSHPHTRVSVTYASSESEVRQETVTQSRTSDWTQSTSCVNPSEYSGLRKVSSRVSSTRQGTRMVTVTKRGYYLERCIGGQIEQVAESSRDVGRIRVIADKDSITLRDSGSSTNRVTVQDSTHMNVPFHGIGLGASELGGSSFQRVRFRPIELISVRWEMVLTPGGDWVRRPVS